MTQKKFQRCYFVYILASLSGTLYVGLTDNLRRRLMQHKTGIFDGFTKKYKVDRLMYFETYTESEAAALREIQIKKYRREKKINLFAASNPEWRDISPEIRQTTAIPRFARDLEKP
ncbi:MAG TPA: GIY-YIG nuclease family protein [Candidatus Angelobacter sp.]|nr:GIY-YIG nuclease family protein [Candidatus Angelobacter sp.]